MALHSNSLKIGQCLMLLLSISGGVIVIGGLGAATNMCREHAEAILTGGTTNEEYTVGLAIAATNHLQPFPVNVQNRAGGVPGGAVEKLDSAYACGVHLSLEWWLVAYEVFTFIYGLLAVFVEFFHSKTTVMVIFGIKITLATIVTSVYVKIAYMLGGGSSSDYDMGTYLRTGAAGGIVILVANYLFLFLFGPEEVATEQESHVEIHK